MRKLLMTLAAAITVLSAPALTNRADAAPLGDPTALRTAIEDITAAEQVHCRPGRPHHYYRRGRYWDGCSGGRAFYGSSAVVINPVPLVVPRVIIGGPRYRYRRY